VYRLFRRWQRDGTWHRIFEQLQAWADAKGLITWDGRLFPPGVPPDDRLTVKPQVTVRKGGPL
jgi:hypothetical protein